MDGWHALFTETFRLSYRSPTRLGDVRDLQGHGAPPSQSHHQSINGRCFPHRTDPGLCHWLLAVLLASRQVHSRAWFSDAARLLCSLGSHVRDGFESTIGQFFPHSKRDSNGLDGPDRPSRGFETLLAEICRAPTLRAEAG